MICDWDDNKAYSNKKKHGVSFAEAATAFSDPNAIEFLDAKTSDKEERWILVGSRREAMSYLWFLLSEKKS